MPRTQVTLVHLSTLPIDVGEGACQRHFLAPALQRPGKGLCDGTTLTQRDDTFSAGRFADTRYPPRRCRSRACRGRRQLAQRRVGGYAAEEAWLGCGVPAG